MSKEISFEGLIEIRHSMIKMGIIPHPVLICQSGPYMRFVDKNYNLLGWKEGKAYWECCLCCGFTLMNEDYNNGPRGE